MEKIYKQPELIRVRCPVCDEENDIYPIDGIEDTCEHFLDFDGEEFIFIGEGE